MSEKGSAESGGIERSESLYVIALRTAMEKDGLTLEAAAEKFKAQIVAGAAHDTGVEAHLKELERAVGFLRNEQAEHNE
jgi:hypothetical protein